jgi:hypothetical protein
LSNLTTGAIINVEKFEQSFLVIEKPVGNIRSEFPTLRIFLFVEPLIENFCFMPKYVTLILGGLLRV